VGLGLVPNLAVFPYHSGAANHLLARSIDLLPAGATLVGIDEETALVRDDGGWRVAGRGEVTLYPRRETGGGETLGRSSGAAVPELAS
jgi:cyanophycinase-like exopeptidase